MRPSRQLTSHSGSSPGEEHNVIHLNALSSHIGSLRLVSGCKKLSLYPPCSVLIEYRIPFPHLSLSV